MSIIIGISKGSGSPRYGNYARWLTDGRPDVETIDLWLSPDLESDLARIDALLLTGGSDVHPQRYNQPELESFCEDIDRERDEKEFRMLDVATEREIPILGICRGMQVLNVFKGGTLICHLPDHVENGDSHMKAADLDQQHLIDITPGSILFKATGELNGEVNSAHHQAVGQLGQGLTVSARAVDGIVEAVELQNTIGQPYLMAVQWHPERMQELTSAFSLGIRDQFLFEAESSKILARSSKPEPKPVQELSDEFPPEVNGDPMFPIIR